MKDKLSIPMTKIDYTKPRIVNLASIPRVYGGEGDCESYGGTADNNCLGMGYHASASCGTGDNAASGCSTGDGFAG